jgi:hypothetical protein
MTAEGAIDLRLTLDGDHIAAVQIDNRRPLGLTEGLAGRTPDQAVRLVSQLYSVCKFAQAVAGARAVERAVGWEAAPRQRAARRLLLLAETVLEHGMRATLDWPLLQGEPPALGAVKALRGALADLHRDLYPEDDWMRPGGGRLVPDRDRLTARLGAAKEALAEAVFGGPARLEETGWETWIAGGKTAAARLIGLLRDEGLSGFGASPVASLDALGQKTVEPCLAGDDGSFIARPAIDGSPRQTGPLTRQAGHPLVAALIARHGRGLEARLAARQVELAGALEQMAAFINGLGGDAGYQLVPATGTGLAKVEAARGRLYHRVEIIDGQVARYQILAPTEWNFHPEGALAQGLLGAQIRGDAARLARFLVAAIDPCVPCSVEIA